jgi:hypothetical protein
LITKFKTSGKKIDILGGAKRKRKLYLDNVEIKIKIVQHWLKLVKHFKFLRWHLRSQNISKSNALCITPRIST